MITLKIKLSGLIFFGATTCVVGGVLLSGKFERRRKSQNIFKDRLYEAIEIPCDLEGATILNRLIKSDWNQEMSEFLDGLDLKYLRDSLLRKFVVQQMSSLQKNILSLEIICERFRYAKYVLEFFLKLLEVYYAAFEQLELFAKDVLNINNYDHKIYAEAQSYAHCLFFLASQANCVELCSALCVNISGRSLVFKRLRGSLLKGRGFSKEQVKFFDLLGNLIQDFDDHAIRAVNQALRLNETSWRRIENNARLLQESDRLFWESLMKDESETYMKLPRDSFWDGMSLPNGPKISGILSEPALVEFAIPEEKRSGRHPELDTIVSTKSSYVVDEENRSASRPRGSVYMRRKVSNMSDLQVDSEIQEIKKQMKIVSINFNKAKDGEENLQDRRRSSLQVNGESWSSGSDKQESSGEMPMEKLFSDDMIPTQIHNPNVEWSKSFDYDDDSETAQSQSNSD